MPAAVRARPACELSLDLCAFLFPPVLVLAARGAAPLAAVAGLFALSLAWPRGAPAWQSVRGWATLLAALVLWGLASSLWAIEPRRSLLIAARLAGLFAAGLALIAAAPEIQAPRRLMYCLLAGFVTALALAMVQVWTNGALTAPFTRRGFIEPALNNIEDGFGLLLAPLCAMLLLHRRRLAAALLAAATIAAIAVLIGVTAQLGFVLGLVAAVPLYWWRRRLARPAAALSVALILAAPLILPPLGGIGVVHNVSRQYFRSSLWHRLEIWSFVGSRIAEKPLFGWGLDSSRAIPGGQTPIPEGYPWQRSLPLHPHNAPLQVWLELGVPGALLFAALAARAWLALGAAAWPRLYGAAAGASLVTALVIGMASYGVWQEWWIATEFLTLFSIMVMGRLAAAAPNDPTQ